jgi:hypothetical protein
MTTYPTDQTVAAERGGFSVAALKRRGWTDSMISHALGWPDFIAPNPHFPAGAEMHLYDSARVERIERREEFRQLQTSMKRKTKPSPSCHHIYSLESP